MATAAIAARVPTWRPRPEAARVGLRLPAVVLNGREGPQSELLSRLKALRRQVAGARGVPPYVVFSDATLYEMVVGRPTSESELLEISGIGPMKLARYGRPLLQLLAGKTPGADR